MEGSLWSGALFNFTSPIDVILDKDEYSIEEVRLNIAEDPHAHSRSDPGTCLLPASRALHCPPTRLTLACGPQLLEEDELLQEVKSNNTRLLDL